jgi:PAS domain S-box-containing protein
MHLKVLIIEDCEDDAMLLGRYLKNCGFEPKWQRVDNERDLAEAVEDRRWDLVLCDFSMPKLTPFMAVDCVRKVNPDIPIIIVTGAVSEKSTAELMEYGVQDVVFKSDLPRLKSSITKELALARGRREKAAAEHRFAAALENLYQGVALYDADARLITCNRRYRMTVDRCQDEIQPGMHYGAIIDLALQREQYRLNSQGSEAIGRRLLAYTSPTGKYPIEIEQHDGRWVDVQRHRTDDGGIVTVTTDITDNKRREDALLKQAAALAKINNELVEEIQRREATEEALRVSESRANAIFQSAIDGVITFNSDYLIDTVNPAAETMFGYSAAEMRNLHIHHLMLIGEPQSSANRSTANGAPPATGLRLVTGWRRNGEAFPIELTVSPVQLRDRTIYTGIIRDVTERTKLDRMKSEFVSMVSHELRTPLTSIKGSLSLLNTNVVGELPPRARNMISIGLQNAERLLRLINDILDIEKIETGKMEFTFAPMEVRELIEEAIQANKAFLDQFGVQAAIDVAAEARVMVSGDHHRLMQVLANLISNATKYSPEQGTITVGAKYQDGAVRIWVKDQGPGIPESFKNLIFQKFSQADASDTRRPGGTGLGLSIAKAIVEQHRGTIGYDSEPGKGATFYFDLPLHSERIITERMSLSA